MINTPVVAHPAPDDLRQNWMAHSRVNRELSSGRIFRRIWWKSFLNFRTPPERIVTMSCPSDFPLLLARQPMPALASHDAAASAPAAADFHGSASAEMGPLLARLLGDESALYAITRDRRYDAVGWKFVRLHTLLDEQFTEIGARLVQLATRSRALNLHILTGYSDWAQPFRTAVEDDVLEAHIMRELLDLHQALLVRLQAGMVMAADRLNDSDTTNLLADLIASHEKDAFMLRALLWEVQNPAA